MTQKYHSLRRILNQIQKFHENDGATLAVFDLDSTLFDVGPRVEKIFHEMVNEDSFKEQFSKEILKLNQFKVHKSDWGVDSMLKRVGVPTTQGDFYKAVHGYWQGRFFSNEYLKYDRPYPGAVNFVQKVASIGSEIVYLTGRDVQRMGVGTRDVLSHWGFPLDDQKFRLELKPHKSMDDAAFKTDWFRHNHKNYVHVLFFENEPSNIHPIQEENLPVEIVFFSSTHSGKNHPPTEVLHIYDFIHEHHSDSDEES